jgi:hypothetical protein
VAVAERRIECGEIARIFFQGELGSAVFQGELGSAVDCRQVVVGNTQFVAMSSANVHFSCPIPHGVKKKKIMHACLPT